MNTENKTFDLIFNDENNRSNGLCWLYVGVGGAYS